MASLRNRIAAQLATSAMMLADPRYRARYRVALQRTAGKEPHPELLVQAGLPDTLICQDCSGDLKHDHWRVCGLGHSAFGPTARS